MGVDFLRSCHRVNARLVQGSAAVEKIRWYFAAEGAKLLPFPSAFGSHVWEYVEPELLGVGEADRLRSFDKGGNRGYPGLAFQGLPEWYLTGLPAAELGQPVPLLICGRFNLWATGGVAIDGEATLAFSAGIAAAGGSLLGGSAFGMFQLAAGGGLIIDGGATFDGPVDIMGLGGVLVDGSSYEQPPVIDFP
jgi:hypothetical protein